MRLDFARSAVSEIGTACLEFHGALESLYIRSVAGKNLLRNKPLLAPWIADYLDRGKPPALLAHARDLALREVTISGRDIGTVRLSGTLGGIGPELFSGTLPAATMVRYSRFACGIAAA